MRASNVRRSGVLILCALALAGCGGSAKHAATTSAPPDPGDTLRQLVAGAPSPLELLTPESRDRVSASELGEGVAAFADDSPVESRRVGGSWAVAWTSGTHTAEGTTEFMAYAVALQQVGGRWLASIGGPVRLDPLGPDEGAEASAQPQVAVEIKADEPIVDTALLVDGTPLDTRGGGPSSDYISIYGAPAEPLEPGRHLAVAFARAGTSAAARAWWFTTR